MRLYKLLIFCPFDTIVPHILRIYPGHRTQLLYYKETNDILCHMKHTDNDSTISVEWDKEDDIPYILIGNCEGDLWEPNLGKNWKLQ